MKARPASPVWGRVSGVAIAALAIVLISKLVPLAAHARLFGDECFHAYLAEWIGTHGRLPDRLPEFYGGLWYAYPPLLHVLGALWLTLFASQTLVVLNVVLFALLLATLAWLPVPGLSTASRRWAVLLAIANAWLATYSVRLFAEMLTSLLVLIVALLTLRYWRTERTRDAVIAGGVAGLACLAKQTALVLPVLMTALAIGAAVARRPARARGLLIAAGVGVAIALPFFIRNALLFGTPFYDPTNVPGFLSRTLARDVDYDLVRLYRMQPGYTLGTYVRSCADGFGPYLLTLALAALVVAGVRRRADIVAGLLLLCLLGAALNYLSPLHDARHVLPLIPVAAVLASEVVIEALQARRWAMVAAEGALIVMAAVAVIRLEDIRKPFDLLWYLPKAYAETAAIVPAEATVLSLYTYDTFYYTRRKATWPIAWGPSSRLAALFREENPDRFLDAARANGIDYLLLDRKPGPEEFLGSNQGKRFGDCVTRLVGDGRMRVAWGDQDMLLIAVSPEGPQPEVPASRTAPGAVAMRSWRATFRG